jgi:hypothetical protein
MIRSTLFICSCVAFVIFFVSKIEKLASFTKGFRRFHMSLQLRLYDIFITIYDLIISDPNFPYLSCLNREKVDQKGLPAVYDIN